MGRKRAKREITEQLNLSARLVRTSLSTRLASLNLYPGQDAVLLAVGAQGGIGLRDLADTLAVKPPTVTKTLARLGRENLLEKRPAPGEVRQSVVYLTENGEAVLAEIRRARKDTEAQAVAGLTKKQRRTLRKLLAKVERNMAESEEAVDDTPDDITD